MRHSLCEFIKYLKQKSYFTDYILSWRNKFISTHWNYVFIGVPLNLEHLLRHGYLQICTLNVLPGDIPISKVLPK